MATITNRSSVWTGILKFSLVACPVRLFSAYNPRSEFHFNLINPDTGHRIKMEYVDRETEEPVERGHLVKGYEYEKGHYLLIEPGELDALRIESSDQMDIERFVPKDEVPPIFFDQTYYIRPDGDAALDAYAVLRDSMADEGKLAIARVVIARRERTVAIEAAEGGLVAYVLRDQDEIRNAQDYFDVTDKARVDQDMVAIAKSIIKQKSGPFTPEEYKDRYEMRLREFIQSRLEGREIAATTAPTQPSAQVIDLMALLKRSAEAEGAAQKPAPKTKTKPKTKPKAKAKTKSKAKKRA